MPAEEAMVPKDKYTVFDRKEKRYRKSIRSMFFYLFLCSLERGLWGGGEVGRGEGEKGEGKGEPSLICVCVFLEVPKWTRVSQRINPPGF